MPTTTDVKRRRPLTGTKEPDAPAAAPATSTEQAQPQSQRAPVDAMERTTSTSGGRASAGRGAAAALAGLQALEPKPKRKLQWRAALAAALTGLALMGPLVPTAQAMMLPVQSHPPQVLVVPRQTGPPTNVITVRVEQTRPSAPPPPLTAPDTAEVRASDSVVVVDTQQQQVRGGLPEILATMRGGMTVIHGSDPGDFYCEHAFYITTFEALRLGGTILVNEKGEVLTGFMHVPSDQYTYDASKVPVQSERHADRREIVGAAIRGFFEQAKARLGGVVDGGDAPELPAFRMLLTGYAQWGGVVNNPTGDFVAHVENVDAAMRIAFGDQLVGPGRVLDGGPAAGDVGGAAEHTRIAYTVIDGGLPRTIIIEAARLPVTDAAIDGSPGSLQARIRDFGPHAVMSMGVAGGSQAHLAEFHADNGGLRIDDDGAIKHDDAQHVTYAHKDNYALARAIHIGHVLTQGNVAGADAAAAAGAGPVVAVRD